MLAQWEIGNIAGHTVILPVAGMTAAVVVVERFAAVVSCTAGEAGTREAATGEAGTGEAATGEAGTGETATGEAATGEAGTGEAATGEAGTGEAATGEQLAIVVYGWRGCGCGRWFREFGDR